MQCNITIDTMLSPSRTVPTLILISVTRPLLFPETLNHYHTHYTDVTWTLWRLKSPVTRVFIQQLVQTMSTTEISVLCMTDPFRGIRILPAGPPHKGPIMWQALPCQVIWITAIMLAAYMLIYNLKRLFTLSGGLTKSSISPCGNGNSN